MAKTNLQKTLASALLGASLVGLTGCATTEASMWGDYEGNIWAQKDDYKIVTRNDDLYLEKLDGSEIKRLTHTPGYPNFKARFVSNGKYIVYGENDNSSLITGGKGYIMPAGGDDSQRKEISLQEFENLR